jgi:hypothetical protein
LIFGINTLFQNKSAVLYASALQEEINMEEFVAYLVKNVVDAPEQVDVRAVEGQSGLLIEIRVASDDIGKVVGRKGNVIRSLRTLSATIGARLGKKVHLEVIQ